MPTGCPMPSAPRPWENLIFQRAGDVSGPDNMGSPGFTSGRWVMECLVRGFMFSRSAMPQEWHGMTQSSFKILRKSWVDDMKGKRRHIFVQIHGGSKVNRIAGCYWYVPIQMRLSDGWFSWLLVFRRSPHRTAKNILPVPAPFLDRKRPPVLTNMETVITIFSSRKGWQACLENQNHKLQLLDIIRYY